MLIVSHLCRCSQPLRAVQSRLVLSGSRSGFNTTTRQLITVTRNSINRPGYQRFRLSEAIKSSGIVVRVCSSSPKTKPSRAVGYWLVGCSGMVFAAVVLGMAAGYLLLLYCVYYVVNMMLKETNGTK